MGSMCRVSALVMVTLVTDYSVSSLGYSKHAINERTTCVPDLFYKLFVNPDSASWRNAIAPISGEWWLGEALVETNQF